MWQVFLFLLVTPKSHQADVALLLGSDSQEVYVYATHLDDIGHLTCLEDDVSIEDYPGDFSGGKVSAVYLDNIGVFVCGGYLQQAETSNPGCNWLTINSGEGIHSSWNPIEYNDPSAGFTGAVYGKALVAKEFVPEGKQGFWITGGSMEDHAFSGWTHDWEHEVDDSIQPAGVKEPLIRIDHCLVRLKIHNHQHFQYLEIGGTIKGNPGPIIESYHCSDDDCTEWTWSAHTLTSNPDLTRPTCTVYTPPSSSDEVVLIVSGGLTFKITCEYWDQKSISCTWDIEELIHLRSQINEDPLYPDTDRASMVNLDGAPHIFGVDGRFEDRQVFKFMEDRWEELQLMNAAKENLVAVSVPEEYICYGKQPTTSAPDTTAGRTLSTLLSTTTTEPATSPDPEPCDNTGTCKRADNRDVEWEGEYGEKVVKTCSEAGVEGEGSVLTVLLSDKNKEFTIPPRERVLELMMINYPNTPQFPFLQDPPTGSAPPA